MYDINFGIILGKEITLYQIISNILFMNSVQTQKMMWLK